MANTIILPFSELQAELNDEAMIDPNAVIDITENGLYNVAKYGYANVNVEGGGGETWETVFEGSVTTVQEEEGDPWADLPEVADLSADTIKVTFNGVEYTCEKQSEGGGIIYYGSDDFSEYPFYISINPRGSSIQTQTAGTYTLKIEEPQSGGSSDFSTAEVTLTTDVELYGCFVSEDGYSQSAVGGFEGTFTIILYKGKALLNIDGTVQSTSGNIQYDSDFGSYFVTGDCTIN